MKTVCACVCVCVSVQEPKKKPWLVCSKSGLADLIYSTLVKEETQCSVSSTPLSRLLSLSLSLTLRGGVGCSDEQCVCKTDNYGILWGVLPISLRNMATYHLCGNEAVYALWEPNLATRNIPHYLTAGLNHDWGTWPTYFVQHYPIVKIQYIQNEHPIHVLYVHTQS